MRLHQGWARSCQGPPKKSLARSLFVYENEFVVFTRLKFLQNLKINLSRKSGFFSVTRMRVPYIFFNRHDVAGFNIHLAPVG